MVEVWLEVVLKEKVEVELKLLAIFKPKEVFEAIVVKDIDEKLLEISLDRFAIII